MNIRKIITDLNITRSYNCDPEKSNDIKNCIRALLRYAEAEESLGIDLVELIKVWNTVLKKGFFWTKYDGKTDITNDVEIGDEVNGLEYIYFYWPDGKHLALYLKEYGETWGIN